MIDVQHFLDLGYYVGDVSEFIKDPAGFDTAIDKTVKLANDKGASQYWHCVSGPAGNNYPISLTEAQIAGRYKEVEEKNLAVDQQWWQLTDHGNGVRSFFRRSLESYVMNIYPELTDRTMINHQDMLTLYEPGDFSKIHRDGANPGRLCVFLVYLNDTYNPEDGGKLIIEDENLYEEIQPIKGKFAMLDFKSHNIKHSVELVKNSFNRFTYVNFVSNKIAMNLNA